MSYTVRLCSCKAGPLPPVPREPSCEHDSHQPASACRVCQHGQRLRDWKSLWDLYWHAHTRPGCTAQAPQEAS